MLENLAQRRLLCFHSVHGDNVRLAKQGRAAKRFESFCKGLAFSSRPIEIDEIVVMRLAETATNWSGVLRFGVTNTDPQSLNSDLPKYACPDLTNKEGSWAKALTERYCQQGNLVHFYVRSNGEMFYGVNGVQKGLFLSGINCSLPLWVLLDIYGNSTMVEFLDPSEVPLLRQSCRQSNAKPALDSVCRPILGRPSGNLARPIDPPQPLSRIRSTPVALISERRPPITSTAVNSREINHSTERPVATVAKLTQSASTAVCSQLISSGNFNPSMTDAVPTTSTIGVSNDNLESLAQRLRLAANISMPVVAVDNKNLTDELKDECVVCMLEEVNCVLYMCGHFCMCYECAKTTWTRHGFCPICRQPIKDVIKTYKAA